MKIFAPAFVSLTLIAACGPADPDLENPEVQIGTTPRALYKPPECSVAVDEAVHRAVARYNLPRWFYYAVIHRESTFNPNAVNPSDGGQGLTQLTGNSNNGHPYPMFLAAPNNSHQQWRWDKGLDGTTFGPWIDMNDVSILDSSTAWSDPDKQLDRYSTVYAAPAFYLMKTKYGLSDEETLRAVAYHWFYGLPYNSSTLYNPNETNYLGQWDDYAEEYKQATAGEDPPWNGLPATPPYTGGGDDFSSSAIAAPACVAAGAATTITGSFTNSGAAISGTNVDIEVYNSAQTQHGQQYWTNQSFSAGQMRNYQYIWTAPATPGVYDIETGVFDSAWDQLHWNSDAGTITVVSDPAQYNFECSSVQSWTGAGGIVGSIASSTARAYQGNSSLAVNFTGTASGIRDVYTRTAPFPGAGVVVSFRVWVPSGSNLTGVQPYVKQNAAGGWAWTGTYRSIASLTTNAWNTITVTVPSNAVIPLYELGVEFSTNAAWTGTAYVDSISW